MYLSIEAGARGGWDDAAVYKYCNIDLAWGRGAHAGVHDDVVGRHSKYYFSRLSAWRSSQPLAGG